MGTGAARVVSLCYPVHYYTVSGEAGGCIILTHRDAPSTNELDMSNKFSRLRGNSKFC